MHAEVRQVDGLSLVAKADSNHWVAMDTVEELSGHDSAAKPLEMLLMALGGCTAMDVISILRKMQVKYDDLWLSLDAERTDEHPKVLTRIDIEYVLVGEGIPEDKFKKAIDLSLDRYCPVTAMIRHSCQVNYTYRIVAPTE